MNDRFRFRAWDKDLNRYWSCVGLPQAFSDSSMIVEQCTGIEDKYGKLIYEGDIVKETSFDEESVSGREIKEISVICFGGGDYPCSFTKKSKRYYRGFALLDYGINRLEIEVIGNIHENPELLEVEK